MSHLIIVNHVKDGIEMAREYGVPAALHAFIAEHHGTTLVSYFYHSARKSAEEAGGREAGNEVQESFFRYPGPRPRSRDGSCASPGRWRSTCREQTPAARR